MMRCRLGLVFLLGMISSCDQKTRPTVDTTHAWELRAKTIYNAYYSLSDRWTGYKVSITLRSETYELAPEGIVWYGSLAPNSDYILFQCLRPKTNKENITLVGICNGIVYPKEDDHNVWFILIRDCQLYHR